MSTTQCINWLLQNVQTKVGPGAKCDGSMLACLIEQHFAHVSKSQDTIPSIKVSWFKAIDLRLAKLADSLVSEYDRDMQAQLEGKLPMVEGTNGETGETLINIHLQVFAKKRLQFQRVILSLCNAKPDEVLSSFDSRIVSYNSTHKVV